VFKDGMMMSFINDLINFMHYIVCEFKCPQWRWC